MQKLLGSLRRACADYKMIAGGDKIAVGISGGKDSILLLALLNSYRKFSPEKFELSAITIDMGFDNMDFSGVGKFCADNEIEYIIKKTDIAEIVFNIRKESNPCSLCSKMRRGALNTAAKKNGCNKLALGHHADDILETFFLSFIYEGRISTFMPASYMDRIGLHLIRPMLYIEESDVISAVKRLDLPIVHNPCPAEKQTKRQEIKELIAGIKRDIPISKDRMLSALFHPERYNLLDKALSTDSSIPDGTE